jgi:hypothetical protein
VFILAQNHDEELEELNGRPVVKEYNNSAYEVPVNYVNEDNKPAGVSDVPGGDDPDWEDNVEADTVVDNEE